MIFRFFLPYPNQTAIDIADNGTAIVQIGNSGTAGVEVGTGNVGEGDDEGV